MYCEQSLFSQSSLSSAGLERANWPRGKLERGVKKGVPPKLNSQVPPSFPAFSPASPRLSLASLYFLGRVTILRDCSQSNVLKFETMRTAFLEALLKIGATKFCPIFA